ncbi:MAG: fibronectin type III domain-containing protein [Calditrichaeota bacterium]|nr:fibronectin type III domain-containing protein [Calditrichota bacterium]
MQKKTFHLLILLLFLLITTFLSNGCLDSPPLIPERDNPWDPQNPNPPRAPDQFRVFPRSETTISFSWRDRSGNEAGFRIFETINDETGIHIAAEVSSDVQQLELSNRPRKSTLSYSIESFNANGESYLSPPISLKTFEAPPMPPLSFEAIAETDSIIHLSWEDDSEIEDYIEIEQSLGDPTAFHLIVTTPADCTSWKIRSLNPEAIYFYRIRTGNNYGKSIYAESSGIRPGG